MGKTQKLKSAAIDIIAVMSKKTGILGIAFGFSAHQGFRTQKWAR